MNTALSVLVPVYNAQHSLEAGITDTLEILPEVSQRFSLCILDDGSTDDTAEVAYDLSARYPQINVLRHPIRLGLAEAIQTGLDHTEGEIVFIGDEDYSLDPDDLRALWQLREMQRRLMTYAGSLSSQHDPWMEKLLAWKPRRTRTPGFQIIRRQAFEQFRLQQAAEIIRRIDRNARPTQTAATQRPNFLGLNLSGKSQRLGWSK